MQHVFHMFAYTLFCILMLQPPRSVDLQESLLYLDFFKEVVHADLMSLIRDSN